MIVLWILLGLLAALLLWIVFAPIHLYVNTWEQRAFGELYGIARFSLCWSGVQPHFRIRIFFFSFTPQPSRKQPETQKPKKEKRRNKKPVQPMEMLRNGVDLLRTFRVKKLKVRLDTGDYPTNAVLIPVFVWANANPPGDFSINFNGEIGTECLIQNRISRMLPVLFRMRKLFF